MKNVIIDVLIDVKLWMETKISMGIISEYEDK